MKLSERANALQPSTLAGLFERARKTQNVISLAVGEFNEPTAANIVTSAATAETDPENKYTPADGLPELKKALAEKHNCEPENITLGPGSKVLLSAAIALLNNPGDGTILPNPYYPPYVEMVRFHGCQVMLVDKNVYGCEIDPPLLTQLMRQAKRVPIKTLVLNSPNNPTGAVFSQKDLEGLAEVVSQHNLIVIADEAYAAITYGREHFSFRQIPGMAECTVTVRSFSKEYNMTGQRLGYVIAPEGFSAGLKRALDGLVGCPSFAAQKAALAALSGPQEPVQEMVSELKRRRDYLVDWLNKVDIPYQPPEGAFYLFVKLPRYMGIKSVACAEFLLEKAGVAVTPGIAFGLGADEYIRLSYACASLEQIKEAMERMDKALNGESLNISLEQGLWGREEPKQTYLLIPPKENIDELERTLRAHGIVRKGLSELGENSFKYHGYMNMFGEGIIVSEQERTLNYLHQNGVIPHSTMFVPEDVVLTEMQ